MLTFFRRIRKTLLEGDSTPKYLLYAIGEIALVVIGILIALQINNWNTQNQNNRREKQYLQRISSDVAIDANLLTLTGGFVQRKEHAILRIMELYRNKSEINSDTLFHLLNRSRLLSFNLPQERQKATFEELVSSGGLELIRNVELRDRISQFYTLWDHAYHRIYAMQSGYGKFIMRQITMEEFFNLRYPEELSIQEFLESDENAEEFYKLLIAEANYVIVIKRRIKELGDEITALKQLLEKELLRNI